MADAACADMDTEQGSLYAHRGGTYIHRPRQQIGTRWHAAQSAVPPCVVVAAPCTPQCFLTRTPPPPPPHTHTHTFISSRAASSSRATADDRNRYLQAGFVLEVTTGVVAAYLDWKFRECHDAILDGYPGGHVAATADASAGPMLYSPTCGKQKNPSQLQLANEFLARHVLQPNKLMWKNANAQKWGTSGCHIEMAKLFCPSLGEHAHAVTKTDFSRLDGTALFNMLSWFKPQAGDRGFPAGASGRGGAAQAAVDPPAEEK
jgi:hypothetical protein